MKIGGWRTRRVFERYGILSRNDIADSTFKLQESEQRAEQERALAEAEKAQAWGTIWAQRSNFGTARHFPSGELAPARIDS